MSGVNLIQAKIVLVAATLAIALTSSVAMAATDKCGKDNTYVGPGTCYKFDSGYTVEAVKLGILENGFEHYSYLVTKSPNANVNSLYFAVEKNVVVDDSSNYTNLYEPGIGDPTENILIGDKLRQLLKYNPNFNTGLYQVDIVVEPTGFYETMPIFVNAGSGVESGYVFGPNSEGKEIATIRKVIVGIEGEGVAVRLDQTENDVKWEYCPRTKDCNQYPDNYLDATDFVFSEEEMFICISNENYVANSTLTFTDDLENPISCFSGQLLFIDDDVRMRIKERNDTENCILYFVNGNAICR